MFPPGCVSASCCSSHRFVWCLLAGASRYTAVLHQGCAGSYQLRTCPICHFYGIHNTIIICCVLLQHQFVKRSGQGCGKLKTSLAADSLVHVKQQRSLNPAWCTQLGSWSFRFQLKIKSKKGKKKQFKCEAKVHFQNYIFSCQTGYSNDVLVLNNMKHQTSCFTITWVDLILSICTFLKHHCSINTSYSKKKKK